MKIKKLVESVEDAPYTKEEIEMDLKSLTNNFTKKDGTLKCGFEEEKISAVEILKKHYNIVEASGDDRNNDFWYVIEYAEPKTMKESNAFSDGTYTVIDAGSSWKIKDGNGNWLDVEFETDKEAIAYIDELQNKESIDEAMSIHYSDSTIQHMLEILRKNLAEYIQLQKDFPEDAEYYQTEIDKCKEQIKELVEAVGGKVVDESLTEDYEEKAPEGPETGADTGIASMLIKAINDEWTTIDYYNSVVATMETEGFTDMIETIRDITKEENLHVGQLQALLQTISPNVEEIANGESEAEKQMSEKGNI